MPKSSDEPSLADEQDAWEQRVRDWREQDAAEEAAEWAAQDAEEVRMWEGR